MRSLCAVLLLLDLAIGAFSLPKIPNSAFNASFFGLFGGKKQPPPGWIMHKLSVDVGAISLKSAQQPCANWAWIAGIVTMADARGAHIEQQYLIDRLYGGSRCLDSAGDLDALTQKISHDYVLADGQKFRLEAQFTAGAPEQPDPLIVAIRESRPLMLRWRDRFCLLTGMDYLEYIAPTGNKMFAVTQLKLFDPGAEAGKQNLIFDREHDNPADLTGFIDLAVYPK